MRLRLSVDGGPEQHLYGRTVLVANVGTLVAGIDLIPEARPDDGMLDVLVIDPSSPVDWARTATGVLRGRGADEDPSRTHLRGREVVASTRQSRGRQVDGNTVSDGHGFRVRLMPQALAVMVPAAS
jgi:diacylglycerol kinase family enzyme